MPEHSRWEVCPQKEFFLKIFLKIKFTFQILQIDIFWTLSFKHSLVEDYSFWLSDLNFGMCIKNPTNKTCWTNGKDLSNRAPKIKFEIIPKPYFQDFGKNKFLQAMDEVWFFLPFSNPWALRVSGMGCYTSKCFKKFKIAAPYYTALYLRLLTTWNKYLIKFKIWSNLTWYCFCKKNLKNKAKLSLRSRCSQVVK